MVPWEPSPPRQCGGGWTLCDCCCWLLLPAVLLVLARPDKLAAFPTSLSDCQTPTGWNCSGYDDRENDLFLCDTNTCKFDGECLRIGDSVTCVCQFKCNNDYVPVCGSNGDTYQNECYLKQAACKQQSEILLVSEGSCATDAGSGSGDGESLVKSTPAVMSGICIYEKPEANDYFDPFAFVSMLVLYE
ncbi:tomoregulin-2-like protein [Pitangus sulphuratus]|nr:tomoregulin-2-like protein [Pitangus sulphuratus]